MRQIWLVTAVLLGIAAGPAIGQRSRQVDDALLKSGSSRGEEWLSYGGNWAEQRYSPLDQIDTTNVGRLAVAWTFDIPQAAGNPQVRHEATPLIHNGVLYNIAPWSIAYAVDLRTRRELWRADPNVNQDIWQSRICCGVVNRGVALYEGKVIAPVIDGRLRALDAATGKVLWETRVSPDNMPYTITMAPRVIKGRKVIVGVSGGEYAVRGFFDAYDLDTGKRAWRFYTVPGDPSQPFEHPDLAQAAKTWSGEWWKIGGGAGVWNGVAYDDEHDIVYVGTGQPGPWSDFYRGPGDNLYANSIVAVRGATGELVWYYQEVPGDSWDYDSVADLMLLDLRIEGRRRQVIMHAPKNGFFYVLDRVTGELLSADPITQVSWTTGIDPATGKPNVAPAARYRTEPVKVMPGPSGGHVWQPWSYSPRTGLMYFPGTAGGSATYLADPEFVAAPTDIGPEGRGRFNMGTSLGRRRTEPAAATGNAAHAPEAGATTAPPTTATPAAPAPAAAAPAAPAPAAPAPEPVTLPVIGPDGPAGNVLYAWDPVARKEAWRAVGGGAGPFAGGSLATGGNLVFSSVGSVLQAYDARSGKRILELDLQLLQMGPPVTFLIDGRQYLAVSGGSPRRSDAADDAPPPPGRLVVLSLGGAGR